MPFMSASATLDHIKVLDLTRARAGPTAARQLADFGADVIKVEVSGDPNYADMGTRHGPDFQNLHRNKRSLTLDLKSSEGHEIFMKLAAQADVIVENYRPDVKRRLKIAYEDVRAVNKGIVYASISGFGQTGPYANRPGLDQIAQGLGGHMSVTGKPGEGLVRSGAAISDMTARGFLWLAASWLHCLSVINPVRGSGSIRRYYRHKFSCWFKLRVGLSTVKWLPKRAIIIPPTFPWAPSRPRTDT